MQRTLVERKLLDVSTASAICLVAARFMPDVASVTLKPYTVEIRVNTPIATAPILFERYTLKLTETERIIIETAVTRKPFKKNFFSLSISIPFVLLDNYVYLYYNNIIEVIMPKGGLFRSKKDMNKWNQ